MPTLDIFNDNAFSVITLTDAVNNIKYVPGLLSGMGLFRETAVTTLSVFIEERDGVLDLIGRTPRGGPGQTNFRPARRVRPFGIPHFQKDDAVMADEVQGIRAFGSETELETVAGKVTEKLSIATDEFSATQELSRVGAVKGIVTYADGGTDLNLFDEFEVTPPTDVYFDLLASSPVLGALSEAIADVVVSIGKTLGGTPFNGVMAIAGVNFWKALRVHPEVRATYLSWQAAADLRLGLVSSPVQTGLWEKPFSFGGVMWFPYFGRVGTTDYVDDDQAHIFPTGVPNLFRTYYAPADYIETVNTLGRRLYSKQERMQFDKGVILQTQMNALDICTRPAVLIRAHKGHA